MVSLRLGVMPAVATTTLPRSPWTACRPVLPATRAATTALLGATGATRAGAAFAGAEGCRQSRAATEDLLECRGRRRHEVSSARAKLAAAVQISTDTRNVGKWIGLRLRWVIADSSRMRSGFPGADAGFARTITKKGAHAPPEPVDRPVPPCGQPAPDDTGGRSPRTPCAGLVENVAGRDRSSRPGVYLHEVRTKWHPPLPLLREARQTAGPPIPTHAVLLPPGSVRLSFGAPSARRQQRGLNGIFNQLEPSRTVLRQVLDKLGPTRTAERRALRHPTVGRDRMLEPDVERRLELPGISGRQVQNSQVPCEPGTVVKASEQLRPIG